MKSLNHYLKRRPIALNTPMLYKLLTAVYVDSSLGSRYCTPPRQAASAGTLSASIARGVKVFTQLSQEVQYTRTVSKRNKKFDAARPAGNSVPSTLCSQLPWTRGFIVLTSSPSSLPALVKGWGWVWGGGGTRKGVGEGRLASSACPDFSTSNCGFTG